MAAGIAIAALAITSSSQSEAAGAPRPANVAKIEQVANNTLVALLRGGLGQPLSIAYTPDGSEFGVVGARASHVWTADGVPAGGLPGGRPTALAFDRTGLTVSGHANGSLFVAGAGRSKTLRLHGGAIGALVARPSGGVAVGTLSGRVFLVDPDYATVHPLPAGNAPIQSLAISRDGTLLASADAAGVVRVISATSAQVLHTNGSAKIGFVTPAFRPDGGGVYVVGSNGSVQIRGTRTDSRPIHLTPPRSDPAGIAVDPTGIMLAVYEKNGSILLLWANGSSIRRFPAAGGGIVAATFNPQGSRLAAAYADGTIRLWRTRPDLAVTKADLQVTRSAYVVNVTLENIGSIAAASTTLRVGGTEVPVPAIPPAGDFAYRRAIPRNSAEGIRLTRDRGVAIVADSSRTSLEDTFANNRRFLRLAATNVTGSGVRSKIVAAALAGVELKDRIHYNYGPQRMSGVAQRIRLPRVPAYADTSSFVTWCYWQAGAPDPNGRHYDGFGYSGTLVANGRRTASPRPGDLVFYGTNPKVPTVDGVFAGHGQVVIQASEAGPTLEPLHNKRPLLQIRTYPVSA